MKFLCMPFLWHKLPSVEVSVHFYGTKCPVLKSLGLFHVTRCPAVLKSLCPFMAQAALKSLSHFYGTRCPALKSLFFYGTRCPALKSLCLFLNKCMRVLIVSGSLLYHQVLQSPVLKSKSLFLNLRVPIVEVARTLLLSDGYQCWNHCTILNAWG